MLVLSHFLTHFLSSICQRNWKLFFLSWQLKFKTLELVTTASVELNPSSPMFLPEERPVRHVSHPLYTSAFTESHVTETLQDNLFRIGKYKSMTEYSKTWLVWRVAFVFSILGNNEEEKQRQTMCFHSSVRVKNNCTQAWNINPFMLTLRNIWLYAIRLAGSLMPEPSLYTPVCPLVSYCKSCFTTVKEPGAKGTERTSSTLEICSFLYYCVVLPSIGRTENRHTL